MDPESAESKLFSALQLSHMTLSIAESVTGGALAKCFSDLPESYRVLRGSLMTNSNLLRMRLLGVSEDTLKKESCASARCAVEMANGIRKVMQTDYAISTTGDPKQRDRSVYIGVSTPQRSFSFRFVHEADSVTEEIRKVVCAKAFLRLYQEITGETR